MMRGLMTPEEREDHPGEEQQPAPFGGGINRPPEPVPRGGEGEPSPVQPLPDGPKFSFEMSSQEVPDLASDERVVVNVQSPVPLTDKQLEGFVREFTRFLRDHFAWQREGIWAPVVRDEDGSEWVVKRMRRNVDTGKFELIDDLDVDLG